MGQDCSSTALTEDKNMTRVYSDTDLMKLAIEEHLKCSEYPRVGAIVAKDGQILATGFRGEIRKTHAERVAIEKLARSECLGSTVYTTLEPCVNLRDDQITDSCTDLLVQSGVTKVVVGVLDPNASIYSQGYRTLLENNISVGFFSRKLRAAVEEETFEYGELHKVEGAGKRRVPVVGSGIDIDVQFSKSDTRTIPIRWATLQNKHGVVDLSSSNGAVKIAAGARDFGDITEPDVFRFPSHVARMSKGDIAIVRPPGATFCVLVKLLDIFKNDILFKWEVRNT
jgi:diaminohydroxyphosphoribosylaminopyrimidine deaminase/5-amino-6-(5-phosphoribosylamino)uracil reductase